MMKKLIAFVIILCAYIGSFAHEIKFGPEEKSQKRNSVRILGKLDNKLYVFKTSYQFGLVKHSLQQLHPESLESSQEAEIDLMSYEILEVTIFNDQILVFLNEEDNQAKKEILYYNVYDKNTLQLKEARNELTSFDMKDGILRRRSGSFNIEISENGEYLAAYYDLPYAKGEPERFGVIVYDKEFNVLIDKQFSLPVAEELMNLGWVHMSNSGKFYVTAKEYKEKKVFYSPDNVVHHVYELTEEGKLIDYIIDIPEKYVHEYSLAVNDQNDLICTGLYSLNGRSGIAGGFFLMMGGDSHEIEKESYTEFPLEFVFDDLNDKQKEKAEKRQQKGKNPPQLLNHDVRDMVATSDGGAVLCAEEFVITEVRTTDAQGMTQISYRYHYNTIIVMKLNSEGDFEWYAKIPKYQTSVDDGGYYSSYAFHVHKDKMYFMFNDNAKNYEDGNATGGKTYSSTVGKKNNVVSLVELNLSDGTISKAKMFGRDDLSTIVVPKVYASDREDNVLYIFSKKKKSERFGRIKFED